MPSATAKMIAGARLGLFGEIQVSTRLHLLQVKHSPPEFKVRLAHYVLLHCTGRKASNPAPLARFHLYVQMKSQATSRKVKPSKPRRHSRIALRGIDYLLPT